MPRQGPAEAVTIETHGPAGAAALAEVVSALYQAVFRLPPFNADDTAVAGQRAHFQRLTGSPGPAGSPGIAGFRLTTAREADGRYVGFGYGVPLPPGSSWWEGLDEPPDESFTRETGTRTFAVIDFGVLPDRRGRGIGRAVLGELLAGSGAERATLSVRPAATGTLAFYRHLGWRPVGHATMSAPAPVQEFDVLMLQPIPPPATEKHRNYM